MVKITEANRKQDEKNEEGLKNSWDDIECNNVWVIVIVLEEEKKKEYVDIFVEIIVKIFPNMGKEMATQFRNARESYTG